MSSGDIDLTSTLAYLRERITRSPSVLLILGSGHGALAEAMPDAVRIPFVDIPGFGAATVHGHAGVLVAGTLEGVECIALQGRYHLYEGHPPERVTLPVRVAAALGVRTMIVTNAAGAINRTFRPGDLMLLDDHINLMWRNPLVGPVVGGEQRFPDMSCPYDRELRAIAERVAAEEGIRVVRGVYCGVAGPSYETPAEIRMLERFGADAVGMSTVPEVLVARAIGLRVLGISLITNACAGIAATPLTHDEVLAAGAAAAPRVRALVAGVLRELSRLPDVETA